MATLAHGHDAEAMPCLTTFRFAFLDLDDLRRWADELGIADTLDKILSGEIRPKTT